MVTETDKEKNIIKTRKISSQEVLNAPGGLPEESRHCALLAANTLKADIRDYVAMKKEPWRMADRQSNQCKEGGNK